MSLCCLCGSAAKLVKSHIIPEAFFRALRESGGIPLLVTGTPNNPPKRSPIGVYDEGILCNGCEPKFSRFDQYGIEILHTRLDEVFKPISHQGKVIAYESESIDQKLLRQFLFATLWRASVSTHPFYNRINLGPLETLAKQAILDPQQPVPKEFNAVLSRWSIEAENQQSNCGLMDPFRERFDNVNSYRFYFGNVVAYIKADKQNFAEPLNRLTLQCGPKVNMVTRSFLSSSDFAAMKHTAKLSHKNLVLLRKSPSERGGQ